MRWKILNSILIRSNLWLDWLGLSATNPADANYLYLAEIGAKAELPYPWSEKVRKELVLLPHVHE
jgi:hypothetical protein